MTGVTDPKVGRRPAFAGGYPSSKTGIPPDSDLP